MKKRMSDSEYFSIPYYSSSSLRDYILHPRSNIDHNYIKQVEQKASAAKLLGSLIHLAVADPTDFKLNHSIYMLSLIHI